MEAERSEYTLAPMWPAPEQSRFVIFPTVRFRKYYIIFMFSVTFLSLITAPISMAFQDLHNFSISAWMVFDLVFDTVFLVDLILNFRMGFISEEQIVIMNPVIIRKSYLKSWFVPDLLSSLPTDQITLIIEYTSSSDISRAQITKITRIVMCFRVLRLLRIARLAWYIREWEQVTPVDLVTADLFIRVTSMFGIILLILHWNACIQFLIASLQGFPDSCWVAQENLKNRSRLEQYSFSLFRALSQMVTIGYGSTNTPQGLLELWIVMTSITCGSLMYSNMLAHLSAMASNAEQATTIYREKTSHLKEYMAYRKLPKDLCRRIFDYYETRYQGKWFDEQDILSHMSESLKEEVMSHLCSRLVRKVPLFQKCDINVLNEVIMNLQYEMFQPGDVIFLEGSFGDKMFFIEYGEVQVETAFFEKKLMDGDYFGEIALLKRRTRTATVKALTLCNLFSLCTERFDEVCEAYPEMKQQIMDTAVGRLEKLHDSEVDKQPKPFA